jgi:hypothetical protein
MEVNLMPIAFYAVAYVVLAVIDKAVTGSWL